MAYYRLYIRRGSPSGPIVGVEEIEAPDDAAAIGLAFTRPTDHLELWQQGRKVSSFQPAQQQGA